MAEIHPFQGVCYNQILVKDLATVICPPYDVTTPQMQQELYHKNEYNFIRLEHGRELFQDTITDNKYTRSATTLERWLEQGILIVDKLPAIYLHDHYFTRQGKQYRRRGITVRVRLEEWHKKVVYPHEGTKAEPKNDRLSLLQACQANTSPILALFDDKGQQISSLLALADRNKPAINFSGANGESHYVWAITEPKVVNQISSRLVPQPLYIADGHHRYESALSYQHEKRAYSSVSGNEAFNFVMMTLVDFADPGLIILPPHRLVRGISKLTMDGLMAKLKVFFDIEELPLTTPDVWQRVDDLLTGELDQVRLVLFGLMTEHLLVLKLRDLTAASQMIPYFHTELYKKLDVSIVDHIILEKLLELSSDREEASLTYSYDRLDTINRVLDQEYQLAFLLSPIKAEIIQAVADAGDRMPRKSTYFYPKQPAGLVFNRLV